MGTLLQVCSLDPEAFGEHSFFAGIMEGSVLSRAAEGTLELEGLPWKPSKAPQRSQANHPPDLAQIEMARSQSEELHYQDEQRFQQLEEQVERRRDEHLFRNACNLFELV